MKDRMRMGGFLALVAVLLVVALLAVGGQADAQSRERIKWAIVDKLTVLEGGATFNSDVTMNDDLSLVGDLSVDDLSVAGAIAADGFYVANTTGNTLITGTLDVSSTVQLGSNANYPLEYATSGTETVFGSITMTNSQTVTHNLTTPQYAFCTYSGTLTDNEEQKCSVAISGSTVTIYTYKEDGSAGDSGVAIFWQVVGTP